MSKNSINAPGKELDPLWLKIPQAYVPAFKTNKDADLVIVEIRKNVVAYAFRSRESGKVGMVKRSALISQHGKSYFVVRGKKVFCTQAAFVL